MGTTEDPGWLKSRFARRFAAGNGRVANPRVEPEA